MGRTEWTDSRRLDRNRSAHRSNCRGSDNTLISFLQLILSMERLRPDETILQGGSVTIDGQVLRNPVSVRIDHLISNELIEVTTGDGGWSTLYRDPVDGRYWELSYPHSEMHGGGPRSLTHLSDEAVKNKYHVTN